MQRTTCATTPADPAARSVPEQRNSQPTQPRPQMRSEDRDTFYRLAEFSRHSSSWEFTWHPRQIACYQARHCADPDTVIAASSVDLLAEQLDQYHHPSVVRPYVAAHERRQAEAERALLNEMVASQR